MSEEEKNHNPGPVSLQLCEAFREAIMAEIKGLRNTILLGLSISTAIVSLIVYILRTGGT